jgi:hypothetical protein
MGKPDRPTYEERVAGFLEPGERVERMVAGRPASFLNAFYPKGRITRQVVLTDRNLYVFELEGSERRVAGTPSRVLSKHQRGSAPVRRRTLPATLIVGEEHIRLIQGMVAFGPVIARAAGAPGQAGGRG